MAIKDYSQANLKTSTQLNDPVLIKYKQLLKCICYFYTTGEDL